MIIVKPGETLAFVSTTYDAAHQYLAQSEKLKLPGSQALVAALEVADTKNSNFPKFLNKDEKARAHFGEALVNDISDEVKKATKNVDTYDPTERESEITRITSIAREYLQKAGVSEGERNYKLLLESALSDIRIHHVLEQNDIIEGLIKSLNAREFAALMLSDEEIGSLGLSSSARTEIFGKLLGDEIVYRSIDVYGEIYR